MVGGGMTSHTFHPQPPPSSLSKPTRRGVESKRAGGGTRLAMPTQRDGEVCIGWDVVRRGGKRAGSELVVDWLVGAAMLPCCSGGRRVVVGGYGGEWVNEREASQAKRGAGAAG